MKVINIFKITFVVTMLIAIGIAFFPLDALADDCHTGGFCTDVCGMEGFKACTYMDCGNGTQLCMKKGKIGIPIL